MQLKRVKLRRTWKVIGMIKKRDSRWNVGQHSRQRTLVGIRTGSFILTIFLWEIMYYYLMIFIFIYWYIFEVQHTHRSSHMIRYYSFWVKFSRLLFLSPFQKAFLINRDIYVYINSYQFFFYSTWNFVCIST